jgi:hypothetical protein
MPKVAEAQEALREIAESALPKLVGSRLVAVASLI